MHGTYIAFRESVDGGHGEESADLVQVEARNDRFCGASQRNAVRLPNGDWSGDLSLRRTRADQTRPDPSCGILQKPARPPTSHSESICLSLRGLIFPLAGRRPFEYFFTLYLRFTSIMSCPVCPPPPPSGVVQSSSAVTGAGTGLLLAICLRFRSSSLLNFPGWFVDMRILLLDMAGPILSSK